MKTKLWFTCLIGAASATAFGANELDVARGPELPAGIVVRTDAHGQREVFTVKSGEVRDESSALRAIEDFANDANRIQVNEGVELDAMNSRAAWYSDGGMGGYPGMGAPGMGGPGMGGPGMGGPGMGGPGMGGPGMGGPGMGGPDFGLSGNPPGPAGGPGYGYGNPPGPAGGPGYGYGNPPGPAGGPGYGPGYGYGNPPGPVGGPGYGGYGAPGCGGMPYNYWYSYYGSNYMYRPCYNYGYGPYSYQFYRY